MVEDPPTGSGYWTLEVESLCEIDPIKGSRFIALAGPVAAARDIDTLLESAQARVPDARHYCWAYRINSRELRSSDDGEPGGSAGRPILAAIDGAGLQKVGVVVARYFGGTKLGVGGLIRAYGGAAAAVLREAEKKWNAATTGAALQSDYATWKSLEQLLTEAGASEIEVDYGALVDVRFRVPVEEAEGLGERIIDLSGGQIEVKFTPPE